MNHEEVARSQYERARTDISNYYVQQIMRHPRGEEAIQEMIRGLQGYNNGQVQAFLNPETGEYELSMVSPRERQGTREGWLLAPADKYREKKIRDDMALLAIEWGWVADKDRIDFVHFLDKESAKGFFYNCAKDLKILAEKYKAEKYGERPE